MIVSTGKLKRRSRSIGDSDLENNRNSLFACCRTLEDFFKIPLVPAYWMEVSDVRQRGEWVAGEVMVTMGSVVWRVDGRTWGRLWSAADRFLRRHFKLTKKPTRLWCRLLYE